jgi:hypothetical protein
LRKSAHLHGAAIPAALGQRRHEPMEADGQPSCARKIAPKKHQVQNAKHPAPRAALVSKRRRIKKPRAPVLSEAETSS